MGLYFFSSFQEARETSSYSLLFFGYTQNIVGFPFLKWYEESARFSFTTFTKLGRFISAKASKGD